MINKPFHFILFSVDISPLLLFLRMYQILINSKRNLLTVYYALCQINLQVMGTSISPQCNYSLQNSHNRSDKYRSICRLLPSVKTQYNMPINLLLCLRMSNIVLITNSASEFVMDHIIFYLRLFDFSLVSIIYSLRNNIFYN